MGQAIIGGLALMAACLYRCDNHLHFQVICHLLRFPLSFTLFRIFQTSKNRLFVYGCGVAWFFIHILWTVDIRLVYCISSVRKSRVDQNVWRQQKICCLIGRLEGSFYRLWKGGEHCGYICPHLRPNTRVCDAPLILSGVFDAHSIVSDIEG